MNTIFRKIAAAVHSVQLIPNEFFRHFRTRFCDNEIASKTPVYVRPDSFRPFQAPTNNPTIAVAIAPFKT